jgi:fibronectin type 3 domain-containing protein
LVEDTTPPAQVTGVAVTTISSSQLDLSWTSNTEPDLDHYNIYRSTTSGSGNLIAQTTTNAYSDIGLQASTTYYYTVSAVDSSGNEGLLSTEVSGKTSESTGNLMHIQNIDFSKEIKGKSGNANLYIAIEILDSSNAAVEGANVFLTLSGNDGTLIYANGITSSDGKVIFKFNQAKVGTTYTATVTDVVKDGWTYDSNSNVETSDSITV